jgi:hypothetical protein
MLIDEEKRKGEDRALLATCLLPLVPAPGRLFFSTEPFIPRKVHIQRQVCYFGEQLMRTTYRSGFSIFLSSLTNLDDFKS